MENMYAFVPYKRARSFTTHKLIQNSNHTMKSAEATERTTVDLGGGAVTFNVLCTSIDDAAPCIFFNGSCSKAKEKQPHFPMLTSPQDRFTAHQVCKDSIASCGATGKSPTTVKPSLNLATRFGCCDFPLSGGRDLCYTVN